MSLKLVHFGNLQKFCTVGIRKAMLYERNNSTKSDLAGDRILILQPDGL